MTSRHIHTLDGSNEPKVLDEASVMVTIDPNLIKSIKDKLLPDSQQGRFSHSKPTHSHGKRTAVSSVASYVKRHKSLFRVGLGILMAAWIIFLMAVILHNTSMHPTDLAAHLPSHEVLNNLYNDNTFNREVMNILEQREIEKVSQMKTESINKALLQEVNNEINKNEMEQPIDHKPNVVLEEDVEKEVEVKPAIQKEEIVKVEPVQDEQPAPPLGAIRGERQNNFVQDPYYDASFPINDFDARKFGPICERGIGSIPIPSGHQKYRQIDEWDELLDGRLNVTDFYEVFALGQHPLHIKNSINNWKAMELWQSDTYLEKFVGNSQVTVQQTLSSEFGFADESMFLRKEHMLMKDYLELYKDPDNNHMYYMSADIWPELSEDYHMPTYVPCLNDEKVPYAHHVGVSMSYESHTFPLINEPDDSLIIMLDGYKRVLLYPPQQGDMLYEDRTQESRASGVNIADPDYVKHPLFQYVTPHEVILGPGDVLYIPAFWFHVLESSCRTVAIDVFMDLHNVVNVMNQVHKADLELLPKSSDMVEMLLSEQSQCPLINKLRNDVEMWKEKARRNEEQRGD